MSNYTIRIDMKDVAEGDATSLAQQIWDQYGEDYDAHLGEFEMSISKEGFGIDWEPDDLEPA
jgi:hypothetical protein